MLFNACPALSQCIWMHKSPLNDSTVWLWWFYPLFVTFFPQYQYAFACEWFACYFSLMPFYFVLLSLIPYVDSYFCPFLLFFFCDDFLLPIIIPPTIFFSYFQLMILYPLLFIPPGSFICISFPTLSPFFKRKIL